MVLVFGFRVLGLHKGFRFLLTLRTLGFRVLGFRDRGRVKWKGIRGGWGDTKCI